MRCPVTPGMTWGHAGHDVFVIPEPDKYVIPEPDKYVIPDPDRESQGVWDARSRRA